MLNALWKDTGPNVAISFTVVLEAEREYPQGHVSVHHGVYAALG